MTKKIKFKKIVIIGAGYIGTVLAVVLAENGYKITAIDTNKKIIESYNDGLSPIPEPGLNKLIKKNTANGRLKATTEISEIKNAEIILITVGTPLNEDGSANKTAIKKVISSISPFVKDGQLVILKSTVPPFTSENDVAKPLRKFAKVDVAFCPERLSEGNAIEECRNIPIVVGGVDKASGERAKIFWETALGVKCYLVKNSRAAELVKLADNAWIDLNIALAFELAKLADNIEIDILEVIQAANSLPKGEHNVNILLPSLGVGGYCLTKDPLFLNSFSKSYGTIFKTAIASREINDESPIYAAKKIDQELKKQFTKIESNNIQIGVLGLAFKSNTGDCRYTPTLPAINHLLKLGYKIKTYDKNIKEEDYEKFKGVERLESIDKVIADSHVLAFFAGHKEFHTITVQDMKIGLKKGAIIFDGRMYFSQSKINAFKNAGFVYMGVGR